MWCKQYILKCENINSRRDFLSKFQAFVLTGFYPLPLLFWTFEITQVYQKLFGHVFNSQLNPIMYKFEPRHDKTNLVGLPLAWIQTRLRIESDQDPCCSLTNSITSRGTDSEQHASWSDCAAAQAGLDPCLCMERHDCLILSMLLLSCEMMIFLSFKHINMCNLHDILWNAMTVLSYQCFAILWNDDFILSFKHINMCNLHDILS
jgi:hypothetical protein